jgi:hypothetical protein
MDDELRESLRTPFWCPVCNIPMKNGSGGDDKTFFKWGCCRYCHIEFVEHREERWQSGWRPTREDLLRLYEKMR